MFQSLSVFAWPISCGCDARLSSLVGAQQTPFSEDVPLHGTHDLLFRRTRSEVELCVEGVDLEEVAVSTIRRARSRVADATGSVHALQRSAGQRSLVRYVLW